MSKIIILSGSVRQGGNTDLLVRSFADGAKEKNSVEIISVADVQVHPCTGCNACFRAEGNRCIQDDDMTWIYEKLRSADVLVIASPVYFYGISAQLKAIIDRLHTPMRNEFAIKKLALILVGAADLPELFDAIETQYQLILNFFHLEDAGRVLVRGAREKGDVILLQIYPFSQSQIDGFIDLMLDTLNCRSPTILIGGNEIPSEVVKSKLLKLNMGHFQYVFDSIQKNTTKVANIRKYMLAALYNAPATMDSYYVSQVNHDREKEGKKLRGRIGRFRDYRYTEDESL